MLSIIVAMSENRVIGRDGGLPWHLPNDLKRFRALTVGHTIVMGRKTYESIGRPLPERRSIVVTRQPAFHPDGVEIARSFEAALELSGAEQQLFAVGGASIYRAALGRARRLYLTMVHATIEGDIYFPEYHDTDWVLGEDIRNDPDQRHVYTYSFRVYDRCAGSIA